MYLLNDNYTQCHIRNCHIINVWWVYEFMYIVRPGMAVSTTSCPSDIAMKIYNVTFKSLYIATKEGWTWHLSDFPQILIYDVFCRVNKGYTTHFPLKTKWLPWQRKVNFGHFWPKIDHRKFDFLCFWRGLLCSWQRDVKFFNIMLGRAVLCVIFKPKIMSSLIKISGVMHALYHWGLELRHSCKNCENDRSSMQNKS